jgi:L-ascorbate metabolism protein UlaG (beta-lactamase superfamily)
MNIRWLGHASFLIRIHGKKIYIDPYTGDYSEKGNVILVTHGHGDHCDLEKLSMIRQPETMILTSGPCKEVIPPDNVTAMVPGGEVEIDGIAIHAVEAYKYRK